MYINDLNINKPFLKEYDSYMEKSRLSIAFAFFFFFFF